MSFVNALNNFVVSTQRETPGLITVILAEIEKRPDLLKWKLTSLVEAQTALELAKDIKYYFLDQLKDDPTLTEETIKKAVFIELDKKIMSLPKEMASTSAWFNAITHTKLIYYIKIRERWFAGNIF